VFQIKRQLTLCALLLVLAPVVACAGAAEKPEAEEPTAEVAARVGEWSITLEELDEKAKAINMKPYQELYNARRLVLNQLIDEQLVQNEATARGIEQEELFRVEVTEKLQPVTDEEIQAFYDQNKARMGEQAFDQMRGQIQAFLTRQQAAVAQGAFLEQLRGKAGITINLDPPRTEIVVAANELIRGPDTAKVTIVEYSDFQ
jgi:protein-disulfide isomerase